MLAAASRGLCLQANKKIIAKSKADLMREFIFICGLGKKQIR